MGFREEDNQGWTHIAGISSGGGGQIAAASDFEVTDFKAVSVPTNLKAGDDIIFDVTGSVKNLAAGWPALWTVAIAYALVDATGKPTAVKNVAIRMSTVQLPTDTINLVDWILPPYIAHGDVNIYLGKMPNASVKWQIRLIVHQDIGVTFDWAAWK